MKAHFLSKNYYRRFFFFHGKTDDEFCALPWGILRLEEVIHRQLQAMGYKRILFFNGRQLYFYDHASKEAFGVSDSSKNPPQQSKKTSKICAGPLGMKRMRKTETAPPAPSFKSDRLCYSKINDFEMVRNVEHCMQDTRISTALIFTNGLDFILHTKSDAFREMGHNLFKWSQAFASNENICIFILPEMTVQDMENLLNRSPQWSFLKTRMFNPKSNQNKQLTPEMILIGYPHKEEVIERIHHFRLTHSLTLDWKTFDKLMVPICKNIAANNQSLKQLSARLRQANDLSTDTLEMLAGQKETRPAMERLCAYKGLEPVVEKLKQFLSIARERLEEMDQKTSPETHSPCERVFQQNKPPGHGLNLHLILTGNPGTGKTMCAGMIGEILRDAGLLELGHMVKASRHNLVSDHVGGTALQTSEKITQAMGGVLFVDEAYRFTERGENDFGIEAIETIMEAMENHKGDFSVIAAGYPDKMDHFLNANPGLKSRFNERNVIHIPDFSSDVLCHIFEQKVYEERRTMSQELARILPAFIRNWRNERDDVNFGNARDVIQLFENMNQRRSNRVVEMEIDRERRHEMTLDDIPEDLKHLCKPVQASVDEVMQSLDELIGLTHVKEMVKTLMNQMKIEKLRSQESELAPGHYTFVGNPGTGKTTVARMMGKMFRSLGILKRGHLVEISRGDLVAGYMGQTESKTLEVLERSLDGVLFIDEAYQLVTDSRDSFGKVALEAMVAFMENHRHRLCIIAAGYPEPMHQFIAQNPGLPSRFTGEIVFDNYTPDEMLLIFKYMARERHMIIAEDLELALVGRLVQMHAKAGPYFGNARDVRKLLDAMIGSQANRLAGMKNLDKDDPALFRLEIVDFVNC